MSKLNKDIKIILELTNHGEKGVLSNRIGIPEERVRLLVSKGYLKSTPWGDGLFRITAESSAITYFYDKKEKRKEWLANNVIAILALILAALSLLLDLLQWLL